jgi:2'-5' RNA ligase
MPDTLRLFVGIDIDDEWTERLSATADCLRDRLGRVVRWVRPELYHVTVVFLGNHSPDASGQISDALMSAAERSRPFALHLRDIHRLGGHEHAALVAGVDDRSGGLQAFRSRLDAELRARGVPFDSKRLVPHVTLGRPRGRSLVIRLDAVGLRDVPPLDVREVGLVRSDLLPTGPRYETIASARLGVRG